jgi:pyrroline-5-carboxylate reductase
VESLENDGFRGTVINAVNACTEKSKYLSRKKDEEN